MVQQFNTIIRYHILSCIIRTQLDKEYLNTNQSQKQKDALDSWSVTRLWSNLQQETSQFTGKSCWPNVQFSHFYDTSRVNWHFSHSVLKRIARNHSWNTCVNVSIQENYQNDQFKLAGFLGQILLGVYL